MATGNPLLMVWRLTDSTLRLFQFNPVSGFVQLGATSLPHTGSGEPIVEFASDEVYAFLGHVASTGFAIYALRDLDENFTSLYSYQKDDGNALPKFRYLEGTVIEGVSPNRKVVGIRDYRRLYISETHPERMISLYPDSGLADAAVISGRNFNLAGRTSNCIAVHPSYKCIFFGASPSSAVSMRAADSSGAFPNAFPNFNGALDKQIEIRNNVIQAKWSPDGKYLYTVDDLNRMQVFEFVESNAAHKRLVYLYQKQLTFLPHKMRLASDNQRIILVENTGVYTTHIFERKGHLLEEVQTINNFGYGIDWSTDGSLLIDALSKRLFLWNATNQEYVERADLITAIPAGSTVQALSKHRLIPAKATAFAYNSAVFDVANNVDIDVNNLHAFFYTDLMERFDPLDLPDAKDLVPGLPANGKKLKNVSMDFSTDIPKLNADPVKQIFGKAATFRYVLVKDITNDIGVALYDFLGNVPVTQYKELTLTFNDGVLSFS